MELTGFVVSEIVGIFIQITAIVLNGAIICTLCKKSLFQCPSNKFVLSLCLSQFLLSSLTILISIAQSFSNRPTNVRSGGQFGRDLLTSMNNPGSTGSNGRNYLIPQCQFYAGFIIAVGASLTIGLISIDRFITISLPMKYKSIVTPGRTTIAITLSWLVSVLITLLPPIFIFGNETFVHGSVAIPKGALGQYFAIVFAIVTILVMSVMIRCYNRIFKIAKEKCQKVQIGHFTSPVSSISSGWPSSAYYSSHLALERSRVDQGSQSQRGEPKPSLLQEFVFNYLDPNTEGRKTGVLTLPNSNRPRRHHSTSASKRAVNLLRQGTAKWRTFLQHNYNSPRKTISTILTLIGSLTLTQVPLTLALFTGSLFPTGFHLSFKLLLGFGSVSNPILYGFLNRTIRLNLWKFLRIRPRYTVKQLKEIGSNTFDSRKASVSSGCSQVYQGGRQSQPDLNLLPVPNVEVEGQPEVKEAPLCSTEIEDELQSNSSGRSSSFPRKPSQDSGADVSFTDDEEEVCHVLAHGEANADTPLTTRRTRGSARLSDDTLTSPLPDCHKTGVLLTLTVDPDDLPYVDSDDDVDLEVGSDLSEPDDLFDFDEDEVTFERMKEIIKKKFSLTDDDLGTVGYGTTGVASSSEDQPIQV